MLNGDATFRQWHAEEFLLSLAVSELISAKNCPEENDHPDLSWAIKHPHVSPLRFVYVILRMLM